MRVSFLIHDLGVGGAQKHTLDLARGLGSLLEPSFVTFGSPDRGQVPPYPVANVRGTRIRDHRDWKRIGAALSAQSPDLIVAVNEAAGIYAAGAHLIGTSTTPIVTVIHTTGFRDPASFLRMTCFAAAARLSRCLVFVSANQARYWARRGISARRNIIIRNGIDGNRYSPPDAQVREQARTRLGFASDDIVLAMSAVFRPEKNHKQLLRVLQALRFRGLPIKALLIGDGPTRTAVEETSTAMGVKDHTRFVGMQADVASMLAAADIGINCSTSVETLSIAALEMMCLGLPMIMSDVGGASEIVESGRTGFLVAKSDDQGLVTAVEQLSNSSTRTKMGEAARSSVLSDFRQSTMLERFGQVFSDVARIGN